ncbi:MAG TPA: hypothetical protein DDZ66_04040 [Firmicutes bacterium]|nr:hypothetical protein [Bacillota bacterium]
MKKQGGLLILRLMFVALLVLGSYASALAAEKESALSTNISGELDKAFEKALQGYGMTVEGWPEGKVSSEIPPYQWGTVVNSGGTEEEYTILVETNREELQKYLTGLEELEWYVEHDRDYPSARLGNIELHFKFNSKTMLQISVYVQELGEWPADEMPAEITRPEKGLLLGVDILHMDDEGNQYFISIDYDGLEEQDVTEYLLQYVELGWRGDEYMVFKDIEWNGAMFEASIEPYYDMGTVSFSVNLFRKP